MRFKKVFDLKFSNSNNRPLIVGRAILDLGHSMSELGQASNKWHRHKQWVSKEFLKDPEAYRSRLRNLLDRALKEKVEILLLPACVLVWEHPGHLRAHMKMAEKLPWVVCGCLQIQLVDGKKTFAESALVIRRGRKVVRLDNTMVKWLQAGKISVMVAISSTIKWICEGDIELVPGLPPMEQTGIMALDMGHHQYSTRYLRTLGRVYKYLKARNRKAIVLLAFWKFRPTGFKVKWMAPPNPRGVQFQRCVIPHGVDGGEDFLDILRLK